MKFIPRQYQIGGRDFLKSRRYALLGDAPGVGKTGQAIIAAEPHWRILVVCPASVKDQWQQAFLDWRGWNSVVIESSRIFSMSLITIINYDLIYREAILKTLLKTRFDLIIYDESHKLKSMAAKRTKIALGKQYLRPRAKRIWFLTGTPVKNRTIDLFPVLKSCAPEVIKPYDTFLKFSYRYCGAYKGRFGLDNSGASHTEELSKRLGSFMLRREKRDVLTELPPRVLSKVDLECSSAVKAIIREEEEKTIEAAGEDDPGLFQLGEIARIRKALAKHKVPVSVAYIKDLLEEEEKIVIFFYHKEVLRELQKQFSATPSVYIDGSVAPHKRKGIVEAFRTRKEVRLFFGQMEASGEGIDGLQRECSCCVFVEPSWSHTDIEQCIGRLERDGQRSDINVHILTIKDTLESRMMDVVAMKLNVDKKLYNQKEKQMAKKKTVEELLIENITKLTEIVEQLANPMQVGTIVAVDRGEPGKDETAAPTEKEQVVEPPKEDDVSEDAIRARAGDVTALAPDGSGKQKCVDIIKKVGGGKLADLKTPALRKKCFDALDAAYNAMAT